MSRSYGALDNYLSGMVMHSKISGKVKSFSINGYNSDVDTATLEDVWELGGRYAYILTEVDLEVNSASALDTLGGTGVEYVEILGLNDRYELISEKVDLNGLTNVLTVNKYLRVLSMRAGKDNTPSFNTVANGNITLHASATPMAFILAGNTASRQAFFTIPNGFTGFIKQAWLSGDSNQNFVVRVSVRKQDGIFVTGSDFEMDGNNFASLGFNPGIGNIKEKSDLRVEAQAKTQNAEVRINMTLIIVRDDYLESLAESI